MGITLDYGGRNVGFDCWQHSKKPITVAVIDTGADLNHEDLRGRIAEGGYNFILDNGDTYDLNGHGTSVSGTIAAVTNNGKGIAGVAGNLEIKILPLQTADAGEAVILQM